MRATQSRTPLLIICVSVAIMSCGHSVQAEAPVPKVERVVSLEKDPVATVSRTTGVFFAEDFEKGTDLKNKQRFHDISVGKGKYNITAADAYRGQRAIEQGYIGRDHYAEKDPGSAGWVAHHFGDSPLYKSVIADKKQQRCIYSRWYHKFPENFNATTDGKVRFPPKMARMGSKDKGWKKIYSVLFWIETGPEANLAIERHTKAPGTHREWIPKADTNFACNAEINRGRWIPMEMAVILGDGPRSDRVLAWADGVQICNISNDDLAAGWDQLGLTFMMLDSYWNGGSPVDQSRFYDDWVISTRPIGPARTPLNPEIHLTMGSAKPDAWEVEVAEGTQSPLQPAKLADGVPTRFKPASTKYAIVWKGTADSNARVMVTAKAGAFVGPRAEMSELAANTLHFVRVRAKNNGTWSDWSDWHGGFATNWSKDASPEDRTPPRGYLAE